MQLSREGSGFGGRSHRRHHQHLRRILPPTLPPATAAEMARITINPAAVSTRSCYSWGKRTRYGRGRAAASPEGRRQARGGARRATTLWGAEAIRKGELCRDRRSRPVTSAVVTGGHRRSHERGRKQGAKKQGYVPEETRSTMDEPVGGGRGHCRRRRETIGGSKQASVRWVRGCDRRTRGWRQGDVHSICTLYHTAAATAIAAFAVNAVFALN